MNRQEKFITWFDSGEILKFGLSSIENVTLNQSRDVTNIGVLHEKPSKGRVLDYGMRWGVEDLFSDMKTRSFSITKI